MMRAGRSMIACVSAIGLAAGCEPDVVGFARGGAGGTGSTTGQQGAPTTTSGIVCTLTDCTNDVRVTRTLSATDAQLDDANVRICRKDTCDQFQLSRSNIADIVFSGGELGWAPSAQVRRLPTGVLEAKLEHTTYRLTNSEPEPEEFAFTIVASDGTTVLLDIKGVPQYEKEYPNGRSCAEHYGGACFDADL